MKKNILLRSLPSRGFSLVEMMIAMTIGLVIVGALTAVLVSSSGTSKSNDRSSELLTNGRYALSVVKRDIQEAGYYGLTGRGIDQSQVAMPGDCYQFFASNLNQRVWGTNDGVNPFAAKCIPAANYAGSDILVLRYASLDSVATVDFAPAAAPFNDPNGLYFRSAYEQSLVHLGSVAPTSFNGIAPQREHRVEVHIYYVNPNTNGADGIPSLHRVILNASGQMVDELVVSGVQNMQVQYGNTTKIPNGVTTLYSTRFLDAQNVNVAAAPAADSVLAAVDAFGNTLTPWGDVDSIRIWLLVRNGTPDNGGYVNTNAYTMGDQVIAAANDGYRRQVLTSTIQLRN